MKYKPYTKVVITKSNYALCAIYEPHPFRNSIIQASLKQDGRTSSWHTGIEDNAWCWVYYDWCGNPVAISDNIPEGEVVDKFTAEHLWGYQQLADYLNKEPMNKYEEEEKLLNPCCCGGKVTLTGGTYGYPDIWVECSKCGGKWCMNTYSQHEAVEQWNIRHPKFKTEQELVAIKQKRKRSLFSIIKNLI